jgi:putative transposase
MPREARASKAGYCYRVFNRDNSRRTVFHKNGDFAAFVKLLREAGERTPVRLLAYCVMPNHFHLALWPRQDDDLSDYMMWLLTAHVRRYHQHSHSSGHIGQGRFRAFPIQGCTTRFARSCGGSGRCATNFAIHGVTCGEGWPV